MLNTRTCLVVLLSVLLMNHADGFIFKKLAKKINDVVNKVVDKVKEVPKNIVKEVKKMPCKALFGIACPVVVHAVGTLVEVKTGGAAVPVVEPLKKVGTGACLLRARKCKRSVNPLEIMVPFSDEFSDYDTNGDKLIAYEEFVFVVIKTVTLADPSQLREPFAMADANGDGVLDMDEFQAAPFLFAHLIHHQHKKEHIITRETVIGGDETVIGEEKTTAAETYETTIVPKEDTTTIIALNNTENVSVNGDMSANQTDYALNYY